MKPALEVLFTPAEFTALKDRDLSGAVCVVFDILRATSTMMTALANGAARIVPVASIGEALAWREREPSALLAGERDGLRIRAHQSGGIDFDLGNSPREFLPEIVRGKTVVITTTNGTRALRACASARRTLIGTFLGLSALHQRLEAASVSSLLLVCAGTFEEASYEDLLAAGAVCDRLWPRFEGGHIADSAMIARQIYREVADDPLGAMRFARNGRRLLSVPELKDDVAFCLQRDTLHFTAELTAGEVKPMPSAAAAK
jgi:2-phosphosulfolactate phosphatase